MRSQDPLGRVPSCGCHQSQAAEGVDRRMPQTAPRCPAGEDCRRADGNAGEVARLGGWGVPPGEVALGTGEAPANGAKRKWPCDGEGRGGRGEAEDKAGLRSRRSNLDPEAGECSKNEP
mmetsp:Transcript_99911/g.213925  ORF Transcript_99911/g.213925 Transcript_99911/m.213925 type:complete len:119 (+) Transcript_99911:905-1261(+)